MFKEISFFFPFSVTLIRKYGQSSFNEVKDLFKSLELLKVFTATFGVEKKAFFFPLPSLLHPGNATILKHHFLFQAHDYPLITTPGCLLCDA